MPKEVSRRHHAAALPRSDSFQRSPQQGLKRYVAPRLQEQWIQKHLTELAVAGPEWPPVESLERKNVDKHRRHATPLNVVRRTILEIQPFPQRRRQQLQLQQSRVPQHPERPLVRIADERHLLVMQNAGPVATGDLIRKALGLASLDELATFHSAAKALGFTEYPPVPQGRARHQPVDRSILLKDPTVPVAK